jgi:hypothetical protein
MSSSGRGRIEARTTRAAIRFIDTALLIAQAVERGDEAEAKRLALLLSRRAVRVAESLTKLDDMPPRLRNFHRRQRARKRT